MIIQTGMRTDIPAFYGEWFHNRLKEGYVCVRNPYYPDQITRYDIRPDVVDLIGFCTKNPAPFFKYLDDLKEYGQYWFVSITPYGKDIEPYVPNKHKILQDFITLSKQIGSHRIGWRYDPILINKKYTMEYHLRAFEKMASTLHGYTHTCVISFIDLYEKVKRNFPEVHEVTPQQRLILGFQIIEIAKKYDMVVRPCAEGKELAQFGADCSGCMTQQTYETALQREINVPRGMNPRKECACQFGHDIGQYDTCMHQCRYCYANESIVNVKQNYALHDPTSPLLVGNIQDSDIIKDAKQESWLSNQISLFEL